MHNTYLRLVLDLSLMLAFSNSDNLKSDFGEGVICAWTVTKKANKGLKKPSNPSKNVCIAKAMRYVTISCHFCDRGVIEAGLCWEASAGGHNAADLSGQESFGPLPPYTTLKATDYSL